MLVPPLFLLVVFFLCIRQTCVCYLYNMKKVWSILSVVCSLMACNHANKEIQDHITKSDSLAINYFRGDGTMDTVVAIKIIRDKQIISQMGAFVGMQSVKGNIKCGYDGSLHFFKMNQVIQDIDFQMNDANCMQFSFLLDGKIAYTGLSPEAKHLLETLRK